MRVAVLVGRFPKLSETFILNQITGLLDQGVHVDIFAWEPGEGGLEHPDVAAYDLMRRVRYLQPAGSRGVRLLRTLSALAGSGAWRRLNFLGPALGSLRGRRDASSLFPLHAGARLLSAGPHDLVHCQFGGLGVKALELRRLGALEGRLVLSFRGSDLSRHGEREEYLEVFQEGDLFLPVCKAFRDRLVSMGCDPGKIQVHHSGIDLRGFRARTRVRGDGEDTRLISIARLVEKKGVAYGIRAVAGLHRSGRSVRYCIIGDGPLRGELQALAGELGVNDRVHFLGPKAHDEVVAELERSHVLLSPNVTAEDADQEGIPNVLKEAMATGMPVVSTRHSGIPELVEDGVSGFLVEERDPVALMERAALLVDHPERWGPMGAAGRDRVEAEFDSRKLNSRLLALYQALTALPRQSHGTKRAEGVREPPLHRATTTMRSPTGDTPAKRRGRARSLPSSVPSSPAETAKRNRVLVVSFRFPPHGGGGVHRVAAFTKYLHRFRWEPHVLTGPWNPRRSLHDPSLMMKIPEGVPVTRTAHFDVDPLMRALDRLGLLRLYETVTPSLPMMEAGWIPYGYRAGLRLLREGNFQLIYSSGYPMASHVVGYLLKRRTGLPWVADYRDEWSIRSVLAWPTPLHRRLAEWIDGKLTGSAEVVVTTSPVHTRTFYEAFPSPPGGRYVTITNGYDPDDFLGEIPPLSHPPRAERFTLTHVGTFNASRDADSLLVAIRRLIQEGRIPEDRVELLFVGRTRGLDDPWLRERGILRIVGYVPHREAVGTMRASDVLLLLNLEPENILGKTFEYLASGRPIIGLLPEGATAQVVREAGAGPVLDPGDVDAIAGTVARQFACWERGRTGSVTDPRVLARYSREETTRSLARLFDDLLETAGTPMTPPATARSGNPTEA